jgi:hypothetical protein
VSTAGRHAAADLPEVEVLELGLEVLARKLRGELMLGLLEPFAAEQRTGRSMLAEFRRAEAAVAGPRPQAPAPAPVGTTSPDQRDAGVAEWERLRRVGRDNGQPIPEWEIFAGLQRLAAAEPVIDAELGSWRVGAPVTMEAIEAAMPLRNGLGATWSLHEYLRTTRERHGPDFRPAPPEQVAAMLLRVDASRQLLRPGGFQIGIRSGPPGPSRAIGEATMAQLSKTIRADTVRRLSAGAGMDLLHTTSAGNGSRPRDAEVTQALRTALAMRREEAATQIAAYARTRAAELREQRLAGGSTALFAAGAVAGAGLAGASLAGLIQSQLIAIFGLVLTAVGMTSNALKEWVPSSEALLAPGRLRRAERVERWAAKLVAEEVDRLHRGPGPDGSPWARARAALQHTRSDVVARVVDRRLAAATPAPSPGRDRVAGTELRPGPRHHRRGR